MSKKKSEVPCEVCGSDNRVYRYKGTTYLCRKHRSHMETHGEIRERTIRDRNDIEILDEYAKLILRNSQQEIVGEVILDIEDVKLVSPYKWHLKDDGYSRSNKPKKGILLHRFLMNPEKNQVVDHINRNKLDCRKSNLRICTQLENNKNSGMRKDNKTGVRGVIFDKASPKTPYLSEIIVDKKRIKLGRFETLDEAKKVRIDAELQYFGEFAPNRGGVE